MLIGALDPLEGSVIILVGCGMVVLGAFLGDNRRRVPMYWVCVLLLIVMGVTVMFVLSVSGGIGGESGHSMWWGVLMLPYPVGWIMGVTNLLFRLVRIVRQRYVG